MNYAEGDSNSEAAITGMNNSACPICSHTWVPPFTSPELVELKAENRRLLLLVAELLIKNEQLRKRNSSNAEPGN